MNDQRSDDYVLVTATFLAARERSFTVEHASGGRMGERVTLPRSLVHGADDLKLDAARRHDEITFRLRAWKAIEVGLA